MGDVFIVGAVYGKVRAMFDDRGQDNQESLNPPLRWKSSDCKACPKRATNSKWRTKRKPATSSNTGKASSARRH